MGFKCDVCCQRVPLMTVANDLCRTQHAERSVGETTAIAPSALLCTGLATAARQVPCMQVCVRLLNSESAQKLRHSPAAGGPSLLYAASLMTAKLPMPWLRHAVPSPLAHHSLYRVGVPWTPAEGQPLGQDRLPPLLPKCTGSAPPSRVNVCHGCIVLHADLRSTTADSVPTPHT